ncbi:MAG: hypothetical protein LUG51_15995 [Tannerellaceae bacterium]|nr:hypothetical protein [Tannerellaceae bacterium]
MWKYFRKRISFRFIVHMDHIKAIEGNRLKIGSHTTPVGRSGREKVFETILSNRIVK